MKHPVMLTNAVNEYSKCGQLQNKDCPPCSNRFALGSCCRKFIGGRWNCIGTGKHS